MKTLGVIPARGGSKGIPQKNIKLLRGKPLIAYTILEAKKSVIDRLIVSTDCEQIARVAQKYDVEVIIREDGLSDDRSPTLPVIQEALKRTGECFDAVITLQPTSPLRSSNDINEAISLFALHTEADSLVSVVEVPHQYSSEKVMTLDGKYLIGSNQPQRRQEISIKYARNGAAIYITRSERLSEYIFGGKVLPYIMKKFNSFDIDDIDDWEIVERLIK